MIIVNILILLILIGLVTMCVLAVFTDIYRSRVEHRDIIKEFNRAEIIRRARGDKK